MSASAFPLSPSLSPSRWAATTGGVCCGRGRGTGQLVIELNEAGTEYRACGDETSSEFEAGWSVVRAVLKSEPRRLTRKEILERWPSEVERPSDVTLRRWLQRALERGLVARLGDGRASSPFRYTLAGRKFEDEDVLPPLHEVYGVTEQELDARFSAEQE